jgi:polyvinyl alcohol dehydrogenase (cytochrome)
MNLRLVTSVALRVATVTGKMSLATAACLLLMVNVAWAADPDGAALYQARCASCHEGAPRGGGGGGLRGRAPTRDELAALKPESVLAAMFGGAMDLMSSGLTDDEGRAVARYVTGKSFSAGSDPMSNACLGPTPTFSPAPGDWNGWSVDSDNSRYQPNPGLTAEDIPKLKLKWAFGFPGDDRVTAQPTVVGGRVFVGSVAGTVYSLDAKTGCTHWAYKAGASVRSAIQIVRARSGRYVAYFGDLRANAHAVDAENGTLIWKQNVDDHPIARITGAPILYEGRLIVPVASIEEATAQLPTYECCTFRGSVVSLDADTGRLLWKSYTVSEKAKPTRKGKEGTQLYGPAGAAVWSTPTIDPKRRLVYVTTGDSYTDQDIPTSDAIMAFDLDSGTLKWVNQVTRKDNYVMGCPAGPNCPASVGPDFDFGASAILRNIGDGKQILIAPQKSGIVWGLDPDQNGKLLWQTKVGTGSALGGIEWGSAADTQNIYAAVSDIVGRESQAGIFALRLATGEKVWSAPAPKVTCVAGQSCSGAQSAAVSVIPGAVFSGAVNGHFRAYSTKTGEILWDVDTVRSFDTVNRVEAKGGSINGGGSTIAGGMVFTGSGYQGISASGGNVLLAFSVDGR